MSNDSKKPAAKPDGNRTGAMRSWIIIATVVALFFAFYKTNPGEQAVRDMLCRRSDARFIRILPSCIPNRRFRPESRYAAPFVEGRYLEIAQGNNEVEFGRRACLDINAEIIEIATAGEGLAIYWRGDGPHVLAEHGLAIKSAGEGESHSSAIESDSAVKPGGRSA